MQINLHRIFRRQKNALLLVGEKKIKKQTKKQQISLWKQNELEKSNNKNNNKTFQFYLF